MIRLDIKFIVREKIQMNFRRSAPEKIIDVAHTDIDRTTTITISFDDSSCTMNIL